LDDDEKIKSRRDRESLRVAFKTKQLVMRFCAAQRACAEQECTGSLIAQADRVSIRQAIDEAELNPRLDDIDLEITRDLFHVVVQDRDVQKLMDDLDIPPDRAGLFDILDADGSGGLHVTELVQGLLKVRGEARKSDVVASLLAVRAVQEMIRGVVKDQARILECMRGRNTTIAREGSMHHGTESPDRMTALSGVILSPVG